MPEPVADDAWWVDLDHVNAYVLETEEGPVLVDAGLPRSTEDLREAIEETGQDPAELAAVLVTHTDIDHVGGLAELVHGTEAEVHVSPVAAEILTGQRKPPWLNTKGLFQRVMNRFVETPEPERMAIVEDGDQVHGFQVLATPGHGMGHLSFARERDGLVFVGDLVRLDKAQPRIAPPYINYDTDEAEASLRHLLDTVGNIETVCSGHGEPLRDDPRERLERLLA